VQLVKAQARQIHVARVSGRVQSAEDEPQAIGVLRLNAAPTASGEKLFESFMSKSLYRHQAQCNLCGYVSQSGEYDDRILESKSVIVENLDVDDSPES